MPTLGRAPGNTQFFENIGTATSPVFESALTNPFGLADVGDDSTPTFADLDGDGDLDAFIGEKDGQTHFFENTGRATSPVFVFGSTDPLGLVDVGSRGAPSFADLDGDGDLDALIGQSGGNIKFFENLSVLFEDGFESGDTSAWSSSVP